MKRRGMKGDGNGRRIPRGSNPPRNNSKKKVDDVHNRFDNLDPPPMEPTMKCLSVFEENKKIAFACYDEENNEIILETSVLNDSETEDVVQGFMNITRPNLILISPKIASNARLLHLLTNVPHSYSSALPESDKNNTSLQTDASSTVKQMNQTEAIPFQMVKSSAYDLKKCKELILGKLRVMTLIHQSTKNDMSSFAQRAPTTLPYHSLASVVDFDSPVLLRSVGSLLCYLQGTIFRLEEGSTITINTIRHAQSTNFMKIDTATLKALHIFATERHPLLAKGHGKEKEGFSLFTLLDRTKSKVGRQCLREWMLKPLLNIKEIRRRQDGIGLFLRPELQHDIETLTSTLSNVGQIDKILIRMKKCHSTPSDFLILIRTLSAAVDICTILVNEFKGGLVSQVQRDIGFNGYDRSIEERNQNRLLKEISFLDSILHRCYVPILQELHDRIKSIINEELTGEKKVSVVVNYGFHEELDNAKDAMEVLDDTLSSIGSELLGQYPTLPELRVIYLPQVGFLIALDKRNHMYDVSTNNFPQLPEGFRFVFIQENDAFFKDPNMDEMDNEIGDLDSLIKDTEKMIVSELEEDILDCETEIRSTFDALAELDCILSFASCTADLNFSRPHLIDENSSARGQPRYCIEKGRHPLQELIINDEYIPNDFFADNMKRVNLVTGPNFSGKSCYTRQVGVLVYMAHLGCYLPCERALISITGQIVARMSNIETCAVPQSSFQLDLTQMATVLSRSTPNSLILIDEFGKGTAPISGIAVLTAALKKLSTIGCVVICTTHFLEISSLSLLRDGENGMKFLQMSVHIPADNDENAVPLFQLQEGVASSSAGLACAKMAGVHENVISRAGDILRALKTGESIQPIPAKMNPNSAYQPNARAAIRMFLGIDDWGNATDEEIHLLTKKVNDM